MTVTSDHYDAIAMEEPLLPGGDTKVYCVGVVPVEKELEVVTEDARKHLALPRGTGSFPPRSKLLLSEEELEQPTWLAIVWRFWFEHLTVCDFVVSVFVLHAFFFWALATFTTFPFPGPERMKAATAFLCFQDGEGDVLAPGFAFILRPANFISLLKLPAVLLGAWHARHDRQVGWVLHQFFLWVLDQIDGDVSRATCGASYRGALLDHQVLDKVGEALAYLGVVETS